MRFLAVLDGLLTPKESEDGFVLVATLVILVLLVVLGISTTTNTNIELKIAGNDKVAKQNFYMAEGGAYIEAGKVGVSASPYQVSDPGLVDQILSTLPASANITYTSSNSPATFADYVQSHPAVWPAFTLNTVSYSSLVTYLYADTPPKGYDASQFSTYKFKIKGAILTNGNSVIELGGNKIGVKVSM